MMFIFANVLVTYANDPSSIQTPHLSIVHCVHHVNKNNACDIDLCIACALVIAKLFAILRVDLRIAACNDLCCAL